LETTVDARGLACPQPVINTKKALEALKDGGKVVTIVDNEVARDNVVKLARSLDCAVEVEQRGTDYYIHIRKESLPSTQLTIHPGQVILITSDSLGRGAQELGELLMRNFLQTLADGEVMPRCLLFINSGVKLCCEGSSVLATLLNLEQRGVEILSCGTCLDYYQLKEKLCVGSITNMYTILEHLLAAEKVITL